MKRSLSLLAVALGAVGLASSSVVPVPPVVNGSDPLPSSHRPHPSHRRLSASTPSRRRLYHAPAGPFRNLVLLLRFADHTDRILPSHTDISRLYNSEEHVMGNATVDDIAPTGSVREVYLANSHGAFVIQTDVVNWITLSRSESYYADGGHGFAKFHEAVVEALDVLDAAADDIGFNFGKYDLDENGALDGLGVFHSGYGAEFGGDDCHGTANVDRIWSHKGGLDWTSTGSNGTNSTVKVNRYYASSALHGKCDADIVRMGVICHELGHYLGLPDLYDSTQRGNGLGAYDFMSQSWGWDGSGLYPPNLSAWSKLEVGWAEAELIELDGTYELVAASNKVYKITHGFPHGEYLLLENRQPVGYDALLAQGGIAIYHVDERAHGQRHRGYPGQSDDYVTFWPENGRHYKVSLMGADGGYDLERGVNEGDASDLWHAGSTLTELGPGQEAFPNTDTYQDGVVQHTGIRIFGFSESGNVMTFSVEGLPTSQPSLQPSLHPTISSHPSSQPTSSIRPSSSLGPSGNPSSKPSSQPSSQPSTSDQPSILSSSQPSCQPSMTPSMTQIPSPTYHWPQQPNQIVSSTSTPTYEGVGTLGDTDDPDPTESSIFK